MRKAQKNLIGQNFRQLEYCTTKRPNSQKFRR